jgi:hypothetical protein
MDQLFDFLTVQPAAFQKVQPHQFVTLVGG